MSDRAAASLPAEHMLYAPGLKRRVRPTTGQEVRYWVPPEKDVKAGWAVRTVPLDADLDEQELASRCRALWAELESWRAGAPATPTRHTISWLIDRYISDSYSPFHGHSADTRNDYLFCCKVIRATIGERRIDPVSEGGAWRPRILGEDIRRWHRLWGKPVDVIENGKPVLAADGTRLQAASTPSSARHQINMLRALITYAVTLGVHGASEVREILSVMKFAGPKTRPVSPGVEQVLALVNAACADGSLSIAITTLAQFELTERRISILGRWEREQWRPGWLWSGVTKDWVITYFQNKRGPVERTFDLKRIPRLLELMQGIPADQRVGAIIKCEGTGRPWRKRHFADEFRRIARLAGIPDDVWSMDMRAAGATEADLIPSITPRMLQDGLGHSNLKSQETYRRAKQRNAQNVVDIRQKARGE